MLKTVIFQGMMYKKVVQINYFSDFQYFIGYNSF